MPQRLSEAQVRERLAALSAWSGDTATIRRTAELASFPSAIDAVRQVADVAEDMNHHPDIDIRYRSVTFACSTHSAGGVTDLDIELARRIDEIIAASS